MIPTNMFFLIFLFILRLTDQICPELKVAVTVSSKGTQMLIPDTGVELYVPGGSLLSRQLIELKVIDFDNDKFDALFSLDSNSSVAVQLLPNKATLRWPARLRLPHCLRLKANFHELKSHVKIYRSEHAPGRCLVHSEGRKQGQNPENVSHDQPFENFRKSS